MPKTHAPSALFVSRLVKIRVGSLIFPVFSLMIREFERGEQFASDCLIRPTIRDFRFLRGKAEIVRMLPRFLRPEGTRERFRFGPR